LSTGDVQISFAYLIYIDWRQDAHSIRDSENLVIQIKSAIAYSTKEH
jgi:hypothetical protein